MKSSAKGTTQRNTIFKNFKQENENFKISNPSADN
jgi:hypothetical protein